AAKGDRTCRAADKSAWREFRNLGQLALVESDERALAPRSPKRPAETRVQPAGVRRPADAGIGDFDGDRKRVGAQPVVDRKGERERIHRTRARIVAQGKPHKVRP